MDKLQSRHSSQSRPLWERQKADRGHYSSVDKAISAHRKRNAARMERVESRLQAAKAITEQFVVKPQNSPIRNQAMNQNQAMIQNQSPIQNQMTPMDSVNIDANQQAQWDPIASSQIPMDAIYKDAQLAPVTDHAIEILEKDIQVPQGDDGIDEDMPKGSYIDYQV